MKLNPENDKMKIRVYETLLDEMITIDVDLLVLSVGMNPSKGTTEVVEKIGLARGPNGFLSEVHGCLKPVETKNMGIYVCGCATGPKNIPYSVSSALGAASKAAALLSNDIIRLELIIAEVDQELCMGCHRCEKICEFDAISVAENDIAIVNELKCKGCGACVTSCPARAIDLKYYRDVQFEQEIKGIGETLPQIQIIDD